MYSGRIYQSIVICIIFILYFIGHRKYINICWCREHMKQWHPFLPIIPLNNHCQAIELILLRLLVSLLRIQWPGHWCFNSVAQNPKCEANPWFVETTMEIYTQKQPKGLSMIIVFFCTMFLLLKWFLWCSKHCWHPGLASPKMFKKPAIEPVLKKPWAANTGCHKQ